jgi:hypothetical protein
VDTKATQLICDEKKCTSTLVKMSNSLCLVKFIGISGDVNFTVLVKFTLVEVSNSLCLFKFIGISGDVNFTVLVKFRLVEMSNSH